MRNYLAKCEEINVELTQDPNDNGLVSSVKIPYKVGSATAQTPQDLLFLSFLS
jgi:hypothetical protein